ncbi:hypothetical protein X975_12919, partial [Stegodyphus mimosarum]
MLKTIGFKIILCIFIFVNIAAQELNPNTESLFETDDILKNLEFSQHSESADARKFLEIKQQAD